MRRMKGEKDRVFACALIALCLISRGRSAIAQVKSVHIQIEEANPIARFSGDFIGFGYETSAVAQRDFFSPKNERMIHLYANLSPHGLIRIGGNVSDHTRFAADGVAVAKTERDVTIINDACLKDLGDFARATDWRVMWGLNLGTGTPEEAVEEAVAVDRALGDRLHSFEIGNEVDLMRKYSNKYDVYYADYLAYKSAIRAKLPHAIFSGPDVAGNLSFLEKFVSTEAADMALATHHYYRTGAASRDATVENLLARDGGFDGRLTRLSNLCSSHHVEYRINEVNSFYGGGKEGVSDTFASALWCLDYLFDLAAHGCNGVNLETDINQHGFVSFYSPIAHDADGICSARPEYYGILAFALAAHGELLKTDVQNAGLNLAAFATRNDRGTLYLAIDNKDLANDADVDWPVPAGYGNGSADLLTAESPQAKSGVTFGGAAVSDDGRFALGKPVEISIADGVAHLRLVRASAAVIEIRRAH